MAIEAEPTSPPAKLGSAFWRVFAASGISNIGDGVDAAAFPLFTAALTRDPRLVALAATAATLPWMGFSLVAGALVDRWDRRRVMVTVNLIRAVLVGAVALMAGTHHGHIAVLLVIFLALGVCETFFDNAAQSLLPVVVAPELLVKANGRQYTAEMIGNSFAGPPLGALLFTVAIAVPFGVDAVSFALSALLIASLKGTFKASAQPMVTVERRSVRRDIAEGLRWLRGHRVLRTLAVILGILNLGEQMGWSTMVLFAHDELHIGRRTYGILLTGFALGGLLGGLIGARIAKRLGTANALRLAIVATSVPVILIGLQSNWIVVVFLSALTGTFAVVWNIITVSLRQQVIPDHLFGRVNSAYRFLGWGGMPIGAAIGGLVAHAFGLRASFIAGGCVSLSVIVVAVPVLTNRAIDEAKAAAPRREVAE